MPLLALDLQYRKKRLLGYLHRAHLLMRFLPAFCFSSSLRLRVMSPP
jgi:hypothetical protein